MKLRKGNASGAIVVGLPAWLVENKRLALGDHIDFTLEGDDIKMHILYRQADYPVPETQIKQKKKVRR